MNLFGRIEGAVDDRAELLVHLPRDFY